MCHICECIKDGATLKELGEFNSNFPNVYVIPTHLIEIYRIATTHNPKILQELNEENNIKHTTADTNTAS